MNRWVTRIVIGIVLLAGVGLIGYPLLSNLVFEARQERLTRYYDTVVMGESQEERSRQWDECAAYNRGLLNAGALLTDPFDTARPDPNDAVYMNLLNLRGDGAMGSMEFPGLTGNLVIYHGTSEAVLQEGVGHLQGSSLPVGGVGTHCVLSAHTGLSTKVLFTNLSRAQTGDVFYLRILGETLAYQVDQIKVVLPGNTRDLLIDPEQDYVTLSTCTPYGINTHRLLVRGKRTTLEEALAAEERQRRRLSTWSREYLKAILAGLGIVATLGLIIWLLRRLFRKGGKKDNAQ